MTSTLGPLVGLSHMFGHPFVRYAFLAGTAVALAAGLVGHFVVLRGQVFSGDALSHVAFTGALAALAIGLDVLLGLYVACVVVALFMAALGTRGRPDDTMIGSVFAWVLGLGALFLTIYTTSSNGTNATSGVNVLFGSVFGLSAGQSIGDLLVSILVCAMLLAVGRPLLFSSVDEGVAAALGVPVGALGYLFFGLVGVTAASATQAVGALLLLGLLAAPAGAAQRLTADPYRALWLSAAIAVASMWAGLTIAYAVPSVPPSFGIVGVATAVYAATFPLTAWRRDRPARAMPG